MKKSIVLSLLFAGISLASFANGNGPIGENTANTADVKYISGSNGEFLFDVVYANASGSRFSLAIVDEFGNQLYQGVYSDKKFDKKFMLADPDAFRKLTFVIRNFSDNTVQRFEMNTDSRLVEEVVVKEIK